MVIGVYLQALLLTGARREEMARLRWQDIDFQWQSLTIRDKVDGERTIPLTPYLSSLLTDLKRLNDTPPFVRKIRGSTEPESEWKPSLDMSLAGRHSAAEQSRHRQVLPGHQRPHAQH
jgi:integrase